MSDPQFVRGQAMFGRSTPTYSYALNNPVQNTDPDGRYVPPPLWPLIVGGGVLVGPPVYCYFNPSNPICKVLFPQPHEQPSCDNKEKPTGRKCTLLNGGIGSTLCVYICFPPPNLNVPKRPEEECLPEINL